VLRNLPRAAHGMHHERTDDVADEIIRWLTVSDAAPTVSMRAAVTEGFLVCRGSGAARARSSTGREEALITSYQVA